MEGGHHQGVGALSFRAAGQDDYNKRRQKELPTWNSMAAMHGVHTWRELLRLLELETYAKPRPMVTVRLLDPSPTL